MFSPNLTLIVHETLPDGVIERDRWLTSLREARGWLDGKLTEFHYCPFDKGWIEGFPYRSHVNNLQPHALAGRKGWASYCRRCGREIDFDGAVS
jgi:hypothetical protein